MSNETLFTILHVLNRRCHEVPAVYLRLEDADNTCFHSVLSLLHACSLSKLDNRKAGTNTDYMRDPTTQTTEFEVSDLETAGKKPLERKRKAVRQEENDRLDSTLEMSPTLAIN